MADDEDKPPSLRVVSDNPNAHSDRQVRWAKEEAQRALATLAATILRTMAGSETEAHNLVRRIGEFIDAQKQLHALSGEWLSFEDEQKALSLPHPEMDTTSDNRYREWQHDRGMETIVQGALRLAAHQVLGERPHFGGKYSSRLISDGIDMIERAFKPSAPSKPPTKLGKAKKAPQAVSRDLPKVKPEPSVRKKPWSSRDSRSWKDPKPEE